MLFPTFSFLVFFLAVFTGFWYVFRTVNTRRMFLLAANFVFYAFWDWRFCFLLLFSAAVNYGFGRRIGSSREHLPRKVWLVLSVVFNLLLLGFFKYYNFFAGQVNALIQWISGSAGDGAAPFFLPVLAVVMPVGISFYTFKAMSYVFDVYLCKIPASKNFADVLLYVSFFPQIASGPITHAVDFLPALPGVLSAGTEGGSRAVPFARASSYIVSGLLKKLVFSNFLMTLTVSPVFQDLSAVHSLDALFAALAYTVVIYCDFSGYSDMAIGVALLLGFRTPENFRRPYASFSVTEFWKRWHISFSSWLRNYLYFSMGGSRFGLSRTLAALFFTMVLGGLWHGASWTFLLWGVMQGTALAAERLFRLGEKKRAGLFPRALQFTATFLFTVVSWVVFRAASLSEIGAWFAALVRFSPSVSYVTPLTVILVAAGILMHFIPSRVRDTLFRVWKFSPWFVQAALLAVFAAGLQVTGMSSVAPFIYFQF